MDDQKTHRMEFMDAFKEACILHAWDPYTTVLCLINPTATVNDSCLGFRVSLEEGIRPEVYRVETPNYVLLTQPNVFWVNLVRVIPTFNDLWIAYRWSYFLVAALNEPTQFAVTLSLHTVCGTDERWILTSTVTPTRLKVSLRRVGDGLFQVVDMTPVYLGAGYEYWVTSLLSGLAHPSLQRFPLTKEAIRCVGVAFFLSIITPRPKLCPQDVVYSKWQGSPRLSHQRPFDTLVKISQHISRIVYQPGTSFLFVHSRV